LQGAIGVFLEAADAEATQGIHHAQGVDDLMVMQGREPGKGRVERDGRRRRGEGRREGGKKGTRWQLKREGGREGTYLMRLLQERCHV